MYERRVFRSLLSYQDLLAGLVVLLIAGLIVSAAIVTPGAFALALGLVPPLLGVGAAFFLLGCSRVVVDGSELIVRNFLKTHQFVANDAVSIRVGMTSGFFSFPVGFDSPRIRFVDGREVVLMGFRFHWLFARVSSPALRLAEYLDLAAYDGNNTLLRNSTRWASRYSGYGVVGSTPRTQSAGPPAGPPPHYFA